MSEHTNDKGERSHGNIKHQLEYKGSLHWSMCLIRDTWMLVICTFVLTTSK